MVYIIYITLFLLFLTIYFIDKIIEFINLFKNTFRNPRIIRDLSLGTFINGLFNILNTDTHLGLFGYILLTIIAMIGIINADKKIEGN